MSARNSSPPRQRYSYVVLQVLLPIRLIGIPRATARWKQGA
ncbi:hypothetical protein ACU4GD_43030 [Cupriavidus basilensis]